ncbi:HigA family addiction module antitoxin (plasmid) [Microbulbifer sp. TRSA002]|uniref:HigA family addiction module antitoxin n=1 Tax=Microbulbifer sp. TRSA002 TaxID=3243382 RepID=UPI00403999DA
MTIKREVAPMSAGATLKYWQFADLELTQEEIAKRLGVSRKHLSKVLNDQAPLSPALAVKIESEFNISAEVLMRVEVKHRLYRERQAAKENLRPVKAPRVSRPALQPA